MTSRNVSNSKPSVDIPEDTPASYLGQEYARWNRLFQAQPALTQRFLELQSRGLAEALDQALSQASFNLPDQVVDLLGPAGSSKTLRIPPDARQQMVGGLFDRLARTGMNVLLRQRLDELEAVPNLGVMIGAGLIRFATATYLVNNLLPAGRSVRYQPFENEAIPSIPVEAGEQIESAITQASDAIVQENGDQAEVGRGTLQVPFVPAARRFFLPQWVAFDEQDQLLVGSLRDAEAHVASMQRFLRLLHLAMGLAPYMVADEQYQQKRYGMLGQLVNQGRALARYETGQIIAAIQRRAAANDLNRGLSLSLPYFDDQDLQVKTYDFQVIPGGRIMFVPTFVVRACYQEQVKVAQDTRLNASTRRHLLAELQMLQDAFDRE